MMWKLFQLSIMAAVMCGNIYYEWTPNGYLVGVMGLGAAFIATWFLIWLRSLFSRRSPELPYNPTSHHKSTVGARWEPDNVAHYLVGVRIEKDVRNLIEIPPEAPRLEGIVSKTHPLSGTDTFRGKFLKSPARH
jgi:hypothetical protein